MKKDYKKWHPIKQRVNNSNGARVFFHEREVWYCYLGENIGFEEDGKGDSFLRPVIIIRKFNNEIFGAIPLTSRIKEAKYYCVVNFGENKRSSVILSQIRLIDAMRLGYKIGIVPYDDFARLSKKLKELIP